MSFLNHSNIRNNFLLHNNSIGANMQVNEIIRENPNEWDLGFSQNLSDSDEEDSKIVIIPSPSSQQQSFISKGINHSLVNDASGAISPSTPTSKHRNNESTISNISSALLKVVDVNELHVSNFENENGGKVEATTHGNMKLNEELSNMINSTTAGSEQEDIMTIQDEEGTEAVQEHVIIRSRKQKGNNATTLAEIEQNVNNNSGINDHPLRNKKSSNIIIKKEKLIMEREQKYEQLKDKNKLRSYIRNYTIQENNKGKSNNGGHKSFRFSFLPCSNETKKLNDWWNDDSNRRRILPFKSIVHDIEKSFGSGIASFYEYFVTVIYMNIMTFCITFLLLILPWLIGASEAWKHWDTSFLLGLVGFRSKMIEDYSWFYYGGYPARFEYFYGKFYWNFVFWYPVAVVCYFVASLILLTNVIGKRLKRISALTGTNYIYVNLVFNMYDHNTCEEAAVRQMKTSIATRLKERLKFDELIEKRSQKKTRREWVILIARRTIGISMSFILIIGAPIVVGFVAKYYNIINNSFAFTTSIITSFINFLFPLVIRYLVFFEDYIDMSITNLNLVFRIYLVKMATTVALMIRVLYPGQITESNGSCVPSAAGIVFWQLLLIDFIFSSVSTVLGTFILYRVNKITSKPEEDEEELNRSMIRTRDGGGSQFIYITHDVNNNNENSKQQHLHKKYENHNNKESKTLKSLYSMLCCCCCCFCSCLKRLPFIKKNKKSDESIVISLNSKESNWIKNDKELIEFEVSSNVIEILYRQSIIWIGTIMSPMIPLLGTLSCIVLFYFNYLTMKYLCKFPTNPETDGKSSPFNFVLLLLTMVWSIIPAVAFILRPASNCGPHANSHNLTPSQMLSESWSNNPIFSNAPSLKYYWGVSTFYIFQPVTLLLVILAVGMFAYFLFKRLQMFKTRMIAAEKEAKLERREKQFLTSEYEHNII